MLSHVRLFATPGTVTCKAPLSMEFSRQECWGGLPFPTPEDLLVPGIKPTSLVSHALAGGFFNHCTTWEVNWYSHYGKEYGGSLKKTKTRTII